MKYFYNGRIVEQGLDFLADQLKVDAKTVNDNVLGSARQLKSADDILIGNLLNEVFEVDGNDGRAVEALQVLLELLEGLAEVYLSVGFEFLVQRFYAGVVDVRERMPKLFFGL